MELLERYLHQIKRYLPKKDKEEVTKELHSLLLDNLDRKLEETNDQEQALYDVIKAFGDPIDVAYRYRNEQPLITKELRPIMVIVMQVTAITLPGALLLATLVSYFNQAANFKVMELLLEFAYALPGIIQSVGLALMFIFGAFLLISVTLKPKFEFQKKEFDPNELTPIPKSVFKVSMFEEIINILFSVLFLYLINLQRGLIAVYYEGNRVPVLNENFEQLLPLLNISVFIALGLSIYHLYVRRKNIVSKSLQLLQGIYSVILLVILSSSDIFNPIIIDGFDLGFLPKMFRTGLIILAVLTSIGALTEYIKALSQLNKE